MESRRAQLCADVKLRMKTNSLFESAIMAHWHAVGVDDHSSWTTGTHAHRALHFELVQLRLQRQRFLSDRVGYSMAESYARVWHVGLDHLDDDELTVLKSLYKVDNEVAAHLAERGVSLRDKILARRIFKYSEALFVISPYKGLKIAEWTEVLRAELRFLRTLETMGLSASFAVSHLLADQRMLEMEPVSDLDPGRDIVRSST